MKTAVLSGAAGFLGSHLARALVSDGYNVIGVDNLSTGAKVNVADLVSGNSFRLIEHDISESLTVDEDIDLVLHLASPASPDDFARLPIQIMKVGALGTHNLLGMAKAKGARFMLASTSEVYGDPLVHPQPESYWGNVNPLGPRGVYDESKRYAEAMTIAYKAQHDVDVCIARIFNTYGPSMRPNDGRVVTNFIVQALKDQPITVYGDGSQTRSFCYIDDQIAGQLALINSGETGPINIGSGHEVSVLELAELVISITGSSSDVVSLALPTDDPAKRKPDLTLATSLLGWAPKVSLEEGIQRTAEHFSSLGL